MLHIFLLPKNAGMKHRHLMVSNRMVLRTTQTINEGRYLYGFVRDNNSVEIMNITFLCALMGISRISRIVSVCLMKEFIETHET